MEGRVFKLWVAGRETKGNRIGVEIWDKMGTGMVVNEGGDSGGRSV
jgi:hypothetical protein